MPLAAEVAWADAVVRIRRARTTRMIAPRMVVVTPEGSVIAAVAPTIARITASERMTMIAPTSAVAGIRTT